MKLGALPPDAFRSRLRDGGVRLRTGPFVTRLSSPYRDLADAIHYVYADHEIEEEGFADFHVAIVPPRGPSRRQSSAAPAAGSRRCVSPEREW